MPPTVPSYGKTTRRCKRHFVRRPKRLPSNLFQFREGTGEARCVLDCITSLQNGADLLWIETEKPHIAQIGGMVNAIRKDVSAYDRSKLMSVEYDTTELAIAADLPYGCIVD